MLKEAPRSRIAGRGKPSRHRPLPLAQANWAFQAKSPGCFSWGFFYCVCQGEGRMRVGPLGWKEARRRVLTSCVAQANEGLRLGREGAHVSAGSFWGAAVRRCCALFLSGQLFWHGLPAFLANLGKVSARRHAALRPCTQSL